MCVGVILFVVFFFDYRIWFINFFERNFIVCLVFLVKFCNNNYYVRVYIYKGCFVVIDFCDFFWLCEFLIVDVYIL